WRIRQSVHIECVRVVPERSYSCFLEWGRVFKCFTSAMFCARLRQQQPIEMRCLSIKFHSPDRHSSGTWLCIARSRVRDPIPDVPDANESLRGGPGAWHRDNGNPDIVDPHETLTELEIWPTSRINQIEKAVRPSFMDQDPWTRQRLAPCR